MNGRITPSLTCLLIFLFFLFPSPLLAGKPNVVLSQALNFHGIDGKPVALSPGKYLIEQAGPTQMRVIKAEDKSEFLIQAQSLTHEQYELFAPMAFTRPRKNKEFLIELFLPGGIRLEARGSSKTLSSNQENVSLPSESDTLADPPFVPPKTIEASPDPQVPEDVAITPPVITTPEAPPEPEMVTSLPSDPDLPSEEGTNIETQGTPDPEPPTVPSFNPSTTPDPEPPALPKPTEQDPTEVQESSQEVPVPPQSLPTISYQAPSERKPGLRIDAVSRDDEFPSIYVLAPDHVGLTSQEYPILYWCLTQETQYPLDVMISEEDNLNVLLDVRLLPPLQSGIHEFRLEDYGISLLPGVSYRWTVRLVASQSPVNLTASGVIQRKDSPDLSSSTFASSLPYSPEGFAQKGLWYDAFSAVSQLLQENPSHSEFSAQRSSLLDQVGLENVTRLLPQIASH